MIGTGITSVHHVGEHYNGFIYSLVQKDRRGALAGEAKASPLLTPKRSTP
jgi:hypothetical protein